MVSPFIIARETVNIAVVHWLNLFFKIPFIILDELDKISGSVRITLRWLVFEFALFLTLLISSNSSDERKIPNFALDIRQLKDETDWLQFGQINYLEMCTCIPYQLKFSSLKNRLGMLLQLHRSTTRSIAAAPLNLFAPCVQVLYSTRLRNHLASLNFFFPQNSPKMTSTKNT